MGKSIKDLIYFNSEKANSLLSQLNGGLVSEITRALEGESGDSASLSFDLRLIKGSAGESNNLKRVQTEKINLYHEILNTIETELDKNGILTTFKESNVSTVEDYFEFRDSLSDVSYIKSDGWGNFEDFDRFKRIFSNFNEIQRLIHGSQVRDLPEAKELNKQIEDQKKVVNAITDRNLRAKDLAKINAIQKNLDKVLEENTEIHLFDSTWIERVKTFLDTFSPNRLNFRLIPFDLHPDFQILSNLKSEYMLDGDFENTIFTYGSRPNVKLTVLGIVTSCPQLVDPRVNAEEEFADVEDDDMEESDVFEKAFRAVFGSFEEFEKVFFVPNYPKIAISPIAIYREVITKTE